MITFRIHGEMRLLERTSAEMSYVADLIEKGFALPLGYERGTAKNHYLFYSIDDGDCFVAVIDDDHKEVITILPVQWHNAWKISPEAEMMARDLALERENSVYLKADTGFKVDKTKDSTKAVVYCELERSTGKKKGPIGLGKFLRNELEQLLTWAGTEPVPQIWEILRAKMEDSMMSGDTLTAVFWEADGMRVEANLPAATATER